MGLYCCIGIWKVMSLGSVLWWAIQTTKLCCRCFEMYKSACSLSSVQSRNGLVIVSWKIIYQPLLLYHHTHTQISFYLVWYIMAHVDFLKYVKCRISSNRYQSFWNMIYFFMITAYYLYFPAKVSLALLLSVSGKLLLAFFNCEIANSWHPIKRKTDKACVTDTKSLSEKPKINDLQHPVKVATHI